MKAEPLQRPGRRPAAKPEPLWGPGRRLGSGFVAAWVQEIELGSAAAQETATAKLLGVTTGNQERLVVLGSRVSVALGSRVSVGLSSRAGWRRDPHLLLGSFCTGGSRLDLCPLTSQLAKRPGRLRRWSRTAWNLDVAGDLAFL